MGHITLTMLEDVRKGFVDNDPKMVQQVNQTEKIVNEMTHRIAAYASELWERHISSDLSQVLSSYVNGLGEHRADRGSRPKPDRDVRVQA